MKDLIESCQQIPLEMDMVATQAADQQCKVGNNKNTVGWGYAAESVHQCIGDDEARVWEENVQEGVWKR